MDSFKPVPQKMSHTVSPESGKDSILFRSTPLLAAILFSFSLSSVASAEVIDYLSGPLATDPLLHKSNSLFSATEVSNNVITNSGVVQNIFGGVATGNTDVENNTVYVRADVGLSVFGGAGNNGTVKNNHVIVDGKFNIGEDVYGGNAEGTGDVIGNTVLLKNGVTMNWTVLGGLSTSGNVRENVITVENSTLNAQLLGGVVHKNGEVTNNHVVVTGSTINNAIAGGWGRGSGMVSGNTVFLTDSIVNNDDVAGGISINGNAINNEVTVSGGKVTGRIIGGLLQGGHGDATGNTVIIKGNADISEAVLYGGLSELPNAGGNVKTGNTLQIWTSGQVAKNVVNFDNFQFIVTPAMMRKKSRSAGGNALLTLTEGQTDLSNSTISIAVAAGTNPLEVGDNVTLIQNVDQGMRGLESATPVEMSGVQGISLDYRIDLGRDPVTGEIGAVVKEAPVVKKSTSVFSTGRMATMGFLNQGTDFALGDGLDRAIEVSVSRGAGFYGAMSAGDFRYDTGSTSSSSASGQSVLLGVAAKLDGSKDHDVIGSAYVEAGWGSIDDHTREAKGDGKSHYYGFGLMAKYQQNEGFLKGAYGQVNAKLGRVNTDFKSNLYSAEGKRGAYDATATYVGAGVGAGYVTALGGRMSLDVSAAYQWTRLKGYDASVADDPYHFDDIDSHRTKLGARLNFTGNKQFTPYVGLAWEHEFSGTAKGTVYGLNLEELSMKGDAGVGEIGIQFKPGKTSGWTVDAAVKGVVGQREGVAGRVMVNYAF